MGKKVLLVFTVLMAAYARHTLYAQNNTISPSSFSGKIAPANTSFYIDPLKGDDRNTGTTARRAWKTFAPANKLKFSAGDRLLILRPGGFHQSLVITANGNGRSPVTVTFAPGLYNFFPDGAFKTRFNISNTNDVPDSLKSIAIYFVHARHVDLRAAGAKIILRGKMIETCIDSCENIRVHGISFDYQRPTVSELTVTQLGEHYADLQTNPDTKYVIQDSVLTWIGEGWRSQPGWYWQVFNPETGNVVRQSLNLDKVKFANNNGFIRAVFAQNPGFKTGMTYQNRDVQRDCAGIFIQRSKNISLQNMHICFMHGMGVVSQFCENISMDSLVVRPDKNSGRTCSAWADILHFSGCRGLININHSYLSAANDDAINIHGTYLKVMEQISPNKIRVRFMHGQTYGFNAFTAGDSINLINAESLLPFHTNLVTAATQLNDREFILTLKNTVPVNIPSNVVVENITWTPGVWIHNTTISDIPTRGILITTRRKAVIENCVFQHINMSGILVADDANSWFESGMVRDLTIRKNKFIACGEPVINIHPENRVFSGPVHKNISITNNLFIMKDKCVLDAAATSGIVFSNNKIITNKAAKVNDLISSKDCRKVAVTDNRVTVAKPALNK